MSSLTKSIFAMEEDDEEVVTPSTVVEITPDDDDTLDDYDETNDLASDADEIGIAIEQCLDTVAGLEAFHDLIEGMADDEGMSPQTAAVANVALRNIGRTIGLEMDDVVPALEEFSDKTGRKHYTRHVMHKIKLKLSVIWKHIVQFINSWKMKIFGYVTKLVDSAGALSKRAQALLTTLNNGGTVKGTEITLNGTQYRNLSTKGSVTGAATGLNILGSRIRALLPLDEMDTAILEYVTAIDSLDFSSKEALDASYTGKKFKDACSFDTFVAIATKSAKGGLVAPVNDKRFISPDITYRLEKNIYLGEHQLVYCMKQNPDKMLRGLVITWADAVRNIEFKPEYTISAPTVGDVTTLLKAIIEACAAIQASRVDYAKRIKNIDLIIKTSTKFIKQLDTHKNEFANSEPYKLVRSYISGISSLTTVMVEPALSLERQAMDSAKAAYALCSAAVGTTTPTVPAEETPATESHDPLDPIVDDISNPVTPAETIDPETTPEVPATFEETPATEGITEPEVITTSEVVDPVVTTDTPDEVVVNKPITSSEASEVTVTTEETPAPEVPAIEEITDEPLTITEVTPATVTT